MAYIKVAADERDEFLELPPEPDNTVSIATLCAVFPGACSLKYRAETGTFRSLRVADGRVFPPPDGWRALVYICVYPKVLAPQSNSSLDEVASTSSASFNAANSNNGLQQMRLTLESDDVEVDPQFIVPALSQIEVCALLPGTVAFLQPAADRCQDSLIGIDQLCEVHFTDPNSEPGYLCSLCASYLAVKDCLSHLVSREHRLNFMKEYYKQFFAELSASPAWAFEGVLAEFALRIERMEGRQGIRRRFAVKLDRAAYIKQDQWALLRQPQQSVLHQTTTTTGSEAKVSAGQGASRRRALLSAPLNSSVVGSVESTQQTAEKKSDDSAGHLFAERSIAVSREVLPSPEALMKSPAVPIGAGMKAFVQPMLDNCREVLLGLKFSVASCYSGRKICFLGHSESRRFLYFLEDLGVEYVYEIENVDPAVDPLYWCKLCTKHMLARECIAHLTSKQHQLLYLEKCHVGFYRKVIAQPNSSQDITLKQFASHIQNRDGRKKITHRIGTKRHSVDNLPGNDWPHGHPCSSLIRSSTVKTSDSRSTEFPGLFSDMAPLLSNDERVPIQQSRRKPLLEGSVSPFPAPPPTTGSLGSDSPFPGHRGAHITNVQALAPERHFSDVCPSCDLSFSTVHALKEDDSLKSTVVQQQSNLKPPTSIASSDVFLSAAIKEIQPLCQSSDVSKPNDAFKHSQSFQHARADEEQGILYYRRSPQKEDQIESREYCLECKNEKQHEDESNRGWATKESTHDLGQESDAPNEGVERSGSLSGSHQMDPSVSTQPLYRLGLTDDQRKRHARAEPWPHAEVNIDLGSSLSKRMRQETSVADPSTLGLVRLSSKSTVTDDQRMRDGRSSIEECQQPQQMFTDTRQPHQSIEAQKIAGPSRAELQEPTSKGHLDNKSQSLPRSLTRKETLLAAPSNVSGPIPAAPKVSSSASFVDAPRDVEQSLVSKPNPWTVTTDRNIIKPSVTTESSQRVTGNVLETVARMRELLTSAKSSGSQRLGSNFRQLESARDAANKQVGCSQNQHEHHNTAAPQLAQCGVGPRPFENDPWAIFSDHTRDFSVQPIADKLHLPKTPASSQVDAGQFGTVDRNFSESVSELSRPVVEDITTGTGYTARDHRPSPATNSVTTYRRNHDASAAPGWYRMPSDASAAGQKEDSWLASVVASQHQAQPTYTHQNVSGVQQSPQRQQQQQFTRQLDISSSSFQSKQQQRSTQQNQSSSLLSDFNKLQSEFYVPPAERKLLFPAAAKLVVSETKQQADKLQPGNSNMLIGLLSEYCQNQNGGPTQRVSEEEAAVSNLINLLGMCTGMQHRLNQQQ